MTVRIEALGGLHVFLDEEELPALPGQPVRSALLLYLAVEGAATREETSALFWAERAPARSRHSLSQTLYELKRELGEDWVEASHDSIAITDDLWLDATAFQDAVAEERWVDAIHLYQGPFLDGVHLSVGWEFEAWADRVRSRLAREYRLACTRRIEALIAEGRTEDVLELARAWREVDPLEEEAWHRVIESLALLRRRSAALREYERLEELLETQLQVEPVEKTRTLAQRIRAGEVDAGADAGAGGGRPTGEVARTSAGGPELSVDGEAGAGAGPDDFPPVRTAADLAGPPAGEKKRRGISWSPTRVGWVAGGLVLLSMAAGWWARATLGRTTVAEGAERIAVVPFQTSGSGVEEFSEGIVNLVSWNLDEVGALRTVSPRSVLSAWRGRGGDLDQEEVLEVGRSLGAGSVLSGSVVSAGPNVRLQAELNTVDGRSLARVDAEGPGDLLMELVDTLCIRLLRDVWRSREPIPNLRVSALSTGSIPAARHYLRGEYLFWRSHFDSAATAFERAVAIDTTFALAYYRLSEARGWGTPWASRGEVEALDRAYRHRERLPTDARTLVVASVLDKNGDLAVIDTMEAYVSRNPFDAEGWYVLADVRFHAQKVVPAERDELYGPFDRALELSPTMTRALIHPLQLAALENDSIRYARYLEHFREVAGDPGQLAEWPEVLWGPEEAASRTLVRLLSTTSRSPRAPFIQALAAWGNLSADRVLGAFEEAAGRLASGGERDRLSFAHDWASALITYGRLEELERPLAWIRPRDAGGAAVVTIEAAVAGVGAVPGLDEAVRHLETEGPADSAAVWLSGLELSRGQVSAGRGRIEAALSEGGLPPDSPFRALLRAHRGWAVALRGDTATGLDEMDEALQRVGYGLSAALAHHARLELMVPRPHGRDRAIDLLRRTWGDVEFLAPRALLLGRALEMEGRSEEARRAYADALRLWETADPALRALLDPARAALGERVAALAALSVSRRSASRPPADRPRSP